MIYYEFKNIFGIPLTFWDFHSFFFHFKGFIWGNLGIQNVSSIVIIPWFWCWRFDRIFWSHIFHLFLDCVLSLKLYVFFASLKLLHDRNLQYVCTTGFYDYLLLNVAKLKCSFSSIIWFKHLNQGFHEVALIEVLLKIIKSMT